VKGRKEDEKVQQMKMVLQTLSRAAMMADEPQGKIPEGHEDKNRVDNGNGDEHQKENDSQK
jgi:hypothetical protein